VARLIPRKAYAYAAAGAAPKVQPQQPRSATGAVETLSEAIGGTLALARYQALLPAVVAALDKCGCTTVDRIAMWMAQVGHESVGLKYMQELGDDAYFAQYNGILATDPTRGLASMAADRFRLPPQQLHRTVALGPRARAGAVADVLRRRP